MLKKASFKIALFLAALVTGAIYLSNKHSKQQEQSSYQTIISQEWIQGVGYVEPVSEIRRLSFQTGGIIADCQVEVGQQVTQGSVLMTLYNGEEKTSLLLAQKQLQLAIAEREKILSGVNPYAIIAAEKEINSLTAETENSRREFARRQFLFQEGAISAAELDQFKINVIQNEEALNSAQAELSRLQTFVRTADRQLADAKVAVAKAQEAMAKQKLEKTRLRAPFSGTILEILRREGESVNAREPEPVILYANISKLRVRAEIDENYVTQLREGQQAIIFGRGLGNQEVMGQIVLIKQLMGKKTVFTRSATERKDLDVVQVFIDMPSDFSAPVGLEVDLKIRVFGMVQKKPS